MKNSGVVGAVRKVAEPLAEELGYVLWDVEYVKEGADMYLRITIDNEEGITIDDCEKYHRAIDPLLDEADPIQETYHLEISSPGIERELKEKWQIEACEGWNVEAHLYAPINGSKVYKGVLQGIDENNAIVLLQGENQIALPESAVSTLKTYYDFED